MNRSDEPLGQADYLAPVDAAASRWSPDQSREAVPYIYFSLFPIPDSPGMWERMKACPKVRAINYTCMPFYKQISRPFPDKRGR